MTASAAASAFSAILARQRRDVERSVDAFMAAVASNDVSAVSSALAELGRVGGAPAAFRKIGRLAASGPEMQAFFLRLWIEDGDSIRSDLNDDPTLMNALRVLLPRYDGPALTLFRGDSFFNRKRRTYGPSWTSDRTIADQFARGMYRTFTGGSVLLQSIVPTAAIICMVHGSEGDRFEEAEFVVDRRQLGEVAVTERYSQVDAFGASVEFFEQNGGGPGVRLRASG